jgi:hypothetical protein
MIAEMPKAKGAKEPGTGRGTTRVSEKPTSLADQGIDKNLAHRARKAATEFTVGPDSGDGRQVGARKNKRQARRSSDGASSNSVIAAWLPPAADVGEQLTLRMFNVAHRREPSPPRHISVPAYQHRGCQASHRVCFAAASAALVRSETLRAHVRQPLPRCE